MLIRQAGIQLISQHIEDLGLGIFIQPTSAHLPHLWNLPCFWWLHSRVWRWTRLGSGGVEEVGEVEEEGGEGEADRLEGGGAGGCKCVQQGWLVAGHPGSQRRMSEGVTRQLQPHLQVGWDGRVPKGCCQCGSYVTCYMP